MHVCFLVFFETNQCEVIFGDCTAFPVAQFRLSAQAKHDVSKHIVPRKQRGFLKQDQSVAPWSLHQLTVSQHLASVRACEAGNNVQKR
jgi:hypothetical protein